MEMKNVWSTVALCDDRNYLSVDDAERFGLLKSYESPEKQLIRIEAIGFLSEAALTVLIILLYSPFELDQLIFNGSGKKAITSRKVRQFFKQYGVSWKVMTSIMDELRRYKNYLEL